LQRSPVHVAGQVGGALPGRAADLAAEAFRAARPVYPGEVVRELRQQEQVPLAPMLDEALQERLFDVRLIRVRQEAGIRGEPLPDEAQDAASQVALDPERRDADQPP